MATLHPDDQEDILAALETLAAAIHQWETGSMHADDWYSANLGFAESLRQIAVDLFPDEPTVGPAQQGDPLTPPTTTEIAATMTTLAQGEIPCVCGGDPATYCPACIEIPQRSWKYGSE